MTTEQIKNLKIGAIQALNAFYRIENQLLENGSTTGIIIHQAETEDEVDE